MHRMPVPPRWPTAVALMLLPFVTAALPSSALAQQATPAKVIVMTGSPQGSTSVAMYWIGKPLGFQAEENIDAEVLTVPGGNVAQSAQLVLSGKADAALMSPDTVLVPTSQGRDVGLVFAYNFYQRPTYKLLVSPTSGITSVAQLKGKAVGIGSRGNPAEPMLKAFLADAGMQISDIDLQPVGVDIPAAQALKNGQISALLGVAPAWAVWDAAGYAFTALPTPKIFEQLIGSGVAVARQSLKDPAKRDALMRFFRTWAKSTVFVNANPEAAMRVNFESFPLAKPRNLSDADALKQGVRAQAIVLQDYGSNVDGKWGAYHPTAFRRYVDYLGLSEKIADVDALWTNDLTAGINDFDAEAVRRKAATYK